MNRKCTERRGVILLVILGMLALFMLVGVSFVVTSTHARSSALATMSIEQSGNSPDRDISTALLSVVRGSRSPRSAIGPHSILEDLYGEREGVEGVIRMATSDIASGKAGSFTPNTLQLPSNSAAPIFPQYTGSGIVNYDHYYSNGELVPVVAISFGPDRTPGIPGVDDDGYGTVDDNFDAYGSNRGLGMGLTVPGSDDYYLGYQPTPGYAAGQDMSANLGMGADAVVGYYAGRVLTMLDGPLARQSTRIVWFYPIYNSSKNSLCWILVLRPFTGLPSALPTTGNTTYNINAALENHRFVINGRPFNGQGFGYNPLNGMVPLNTSSINPALGVNPKLLNLTHAHLDGNTMESAFPFALLPNPTDRRYRDYMADRSAYTSTGGAGTDSYTVMPLTAYTEPAIINSLGSGAAVNPYGLDADEDYDAPDYQNLHMAWRVWNPMMGIPQLHNTSTQQYPGGRWQTRSPSFHRPELVNYWLQQYSYLSAMGNSAGGLPQGYPPMALSAWPSSPSQSWFMLPGGEASGGNVSPRLRQRIMLRPDPQDNWDPLDPTQNPNGHSRWQGAETFQDVNGNGIWDQNEPHSYGTGNSFTQADPDWSGNVYFNPVNGPWDVDNDNDGEPDSVWLDLGAPVQIAADGTEYKPLFAVLCLDLDGRLNINAHGNNLQVQYSSYVNGTLLSGIGKSNTSSSVSDDSVMIGMWQVHTHQSGTAGTTYAPVFTRTQSVGPYAGGLQNPASWTTSTTQYFSGLPPTNTHSLSVATGLGFSVADVNLAPLFGAPFSTDVTNGSGGAFSRRQAEYRFLLQGCPTASGNYNVATTNLQHLGQPVPGRYGEPHLLNYLYPTATNGLSAYPQAGVTYGQFQGGVMGNYGNVYDSYDDNLPAAGSMLMQVQTNPINFRGNAYEASLPSQLVQPNYIQQQPSSGGSVLLTSQGRYGSPVDPFGMLMVGLDFRGQPIYANMPSIVTNQLIDDPWELDLSPKGKRSSYRVSGNTVTPFQSDAPFTPGELETLLRFGDPDLATLQSRPVQLFGLATQDSQITTNLRNRVTSESWDLPCPNIHPTPEIIKGLQMLGLPTTNCSFADLVRGKIAFVQGLSIYANPPATTSPGALALATEQALMLLNGRTVLAGYQSSTTPTQMVAVYQRVLPAFSSDLLQGLRMDLNRPFGNSWDDNGNGAIDDPDELTKAVELLWRLTPTTTPYAFHPDANNDGVYNISTYPISAANGTAATAATALAAYDVNARAEMAKNLYMLMMLLTDSDWMYWYPTTQPYLPVSLASASTIPPTLGYFNYTTSSTGAGAISTPQAVSPSAYVNTINNPPLNFNAGNVYGTKNGLNPLWVMNAQQKMAAYRIAQWAVNAVDFADRDAIMTGFEFDLCPFNIDGYSVDGNLASYCSCWIGNPGASSATVLSIGSPSSPYYLEPDRAVVWGMEYPDLLITETTAFHDKGWADTKLDNNSKNTTTSTQKPDADFDQARLPQGSLFVELYCPGRPNTRAWPTLGNGGNIPASTQANNNSPYMPAELYDVSTPAPNYSVGYGSSANPSRNTLGDGYANVGTLDLERMTPYNPNITNGAYQYPVWRLALARGTTNPRTNTPTTVKTAGTTLNPNNSTTLMPIAPWPPTTAAGNYVSMTPSGAQSIQNRFMTRPDTTTVLPYTSLSTSWNGSYANYGQRYLAASTVPSVPRASNQTSVTSTTGPSAAQLDSYVVTDFVDTTVTGLPSGTTPAAGNLPAHVMFLQRFVYFCRPMQNTPPPLPQGTLSTSHINNSGHLVYPPYITNGSMPTAALYGATAQTIYQFRPQTTHYGSGSSGGSGLVVQPRLLLHPGSYAVVGPRRSFYSPASVTTGGEDITFVGYNDFKTSGNPTIMTTTANTPWYPQAIDLGTHIRPYHLLNPVMMLTPVNGHRNNDPVTYGGYPDNTQFMTTKIKNPLCIPCASGPPWPIPGTAAPYNYSTANVDRGLNISEPPNGYVVSGGTYPGYPSLASAPATLYKSGNSPALQVQVKDAWISPTSASNSSTSAYLPDVPFDTPAPASGAPSATQGMSSEPWTGWPAQNASGAGTGTSSRTLIDYSTVLLQRLADPTRPWDPTVNPYLTIDWMPIDLTVFNGQNVFQGTKQIMNDSSNAIAKGRSGGMATPGMFAFETRQRGPRNTLQTSSYISSLGSTAAFPTAATGTLLQASTNSPQAYPDISGPQRWPVTTFESAPFAFVMGKQGGGPGAPYGTPSNNYNQSYTNPINNWGNEYCAITEAPLWCQMSDDPRPTPTTRYPGQYQTPSPIMGGITSALPSGNTTVGPTFTAYLYGTLGFLNEGYGIVDFNHTSPAPSPSAIDAPFSSAVNPNAFLARLANYYATVSSSSVATLYDYVGDPARPFPWLTWNNRPYASAMELLLVPASQPARFGWEYNYKTMYTDRLAVQPDPFAAPTYATPIPGGVLWDSHYAWRANPAWGGFRGADANGGYFVGTATQYVCTGALFYPPAPATNLVGTGYVNGSFQLWPSANGRSRPGTTFYAGGYPFGHLLNFFGSNGPQACTTAAGGAYSYPYTAATAGSSGAPIDPLVGYIGNPDQLFGNPAGGTGSLPGIQPSSNFHRIFEYVHVPTRFSGMQELMDPMVFNVASGAATSHGYNPNSAMSHFMAPYNRVSRYREPGKVNLNTISDTWLKGNNYYGPTTTSPAPYYFQHQADIFQGIMNDFPGYQHIWDNLLGGLQILDPRGADQAWGVARNYNTAVRAMTTGDDDGQADYYGFAQTDDQWEVGWPGWQQNPNNGYPTLLNGSNASDDWIPLNSRVPQGQQTLIAGASNERLLNHLAYNPSGAQANFTGPAQGLGGMTGAAGVSDFPYGQGAYFIQPQQGAQGNVGMPTFFPNPFRSFCTSFSVAVPQMLYWWPAVPAIGGSSTGGGMTGNGGMPLNGNQVGLTTYPMPFYWADSSLFRRSRVHPTRRYEPLFVNNSYEWWSPGINGVQGSGGTYTNPAWDWSFQMPMNPTNVFWANWRSGLMVPDPVSRVASHQLSSAHASKPGEWGQGFRDSNRNPYFRYQPLMKLGNIATSHSNVYAIWVTVGYFQVQRARIYSGNNNQAVFDRNPDGYRLVRELGSDTGNVKRHRGFAIFDRTLPVGFLRGENINVNNGFLVKHMIE